MEGILSLFERTADGACGVDGRQRVVLWNRAAEDLLGHRRAEVVGRPCYEVLGTRDAHGCAVCRPGCSALVRTARRQVVPTCELRVVARSGEERWLSVSTIGLPPRGEAVLVHLFRPRGDSPSLQATVEKLVEEVGRMVRASAPSVAAPEPSANAELSRRELEVLRLLAEGRATDAVARTLSISPSTVRNHVHNILTKLETHSRLEAIACARRRGLLS